MHFGDTFKSVERRAAFAHADCRGGEPEGKGTVILGQKKCLNTILNVFCSIAHLAAEQSFTAGNC